MDCLAQVNPLKGYIPSIQKAHSIGAPTVAQKRILVVDDERHIVQLLRVNLEKRGHLVQTANDSREALLKLESQPFDGVILDLMMPASEGNDLLRQMRNTESLKHIRVAILSTQAHELARTGGLSSEPDALLSKPFDISEITKFISLL